MMKKIVSSICMASPEAAARTFTKPATRRQGVAPSANELQTNKVTEGTKYGPQVLQNQSELARWHIPPTPICRPSRKSLQKTRSAVHPHEVRNNGRHHRCVARTLAREHVALSNCYAHGCREIVFAPCGRGEAPRQHRRSRPLARRGQGRPRSPGPAWRPPSLDLLGARETTSTDPKSRSALKVGRECSEMAAPMLCIGAPATTAIEDCSAQRTAMSGAQNALSDHAVRRAHGRSNAQGLDVARPRQKSAIRRSPPQVSAAGAKNHALHLGAAEHLNIAGKSMRGAHLCRSRRPGAGRVKYEERKCRNTTRRNSTTLR